MYIYLFILIFNRMGSFSWYIKDIIAIISHFILCCCKPFSFAVRDVSERSAEKDMRTRSDQATLLVVEIYSKS